VTNESGLNRHHAATLAAIFERPARHNIRWVDVVHLVEAAGAVDERHDGRFKFTIGSRSEVFDRPRDKDIGIEQLEDLRRMFRGTDFEPKKAESGVSVLEHGAHNVLDIRNQPVIVTIDFHESRIYPLSAPPHTDPETIKADDPRGHYHNVYHRHGNPNGTYEADSPEYWRTLAAHLEPASAILLLGHGKGKANASHHFVVWAEKHAPAVAAKILADMRADIDDITDEQLIRLNEQFFGTAPERDHGDDRRSAK